MEELSRLQNWYLANCDGEWEHSNGIVIGTLDNPGWRVEVELAGSPLGDRRFDLVSRQNQEADSDWVHCDVADGKFQGFGGTHNLAEILGVFLAWAENED